MRLHHTKNKGDLGVAHATVDLMKKGYSVWTTVSEHEPFDLIAYKDGLFLRVSVKYRAAKNGGISVPFRSCWADGHGVHVVPIDKAAVDVCCVYCPDTDACYYVDPKSFADSVFLRLRPTKNKQARNVRLADDFREIPLEWHARQDSNLRTAD